MADFMVTVYTVILTNKKPCYHGRLYGHGIHGYIAKRPVLNAGVQGLNLSHFKQIFYW